MKPFFSACAAVLAASLFSIPVFADEGDPAGGSSPNLTRSWSTKVSDSTVEATAVKLTDKAISLRRVDNRQMIVVPLDKLGDADVEWINENKNVIGKSNKELKEMSVTTIGKELKGKTKGIVKERWKKKEIKGTAKYFIIYSSASWCPPCRASAPGNAEIYNAEIANIPELEVVMISRDNYEDVAQKWAEEVNMPWPILFGKKIPAFEKLRPKGIPNLKLIDGEGNMIAEGGMKTLVKKALEQIKSSPKGKE